MQIEVQLTTRPIEEKFLSPLHAGTIGAWVEFRGLVRGEEKGQTITALEFEAYPEMAKLEIQRLLAEISLGHPVIIAKIIHRLGVIPVGETAIYVGMAGKHRGEAFALLTEFMDRFKKDVPIWKRRALPILTSSHTQPESIKTGRSIDEAMVEINSRCRTLPPIHVPLINALDRILRETVFAAEDFPPCDRSTRDGYVILQNDSTENFQVVDTLHAADWRPRQLKSGEAVRVATGAALPCDGARVVMQEHVERSGDKIKIIMREAALNFRKRGEDVKAGQPLVHAGTRLDAGKLALLAAAGCSQPLVSPRLKVIHFTTGDEIVPAEQKPNPGQVRDSNSILLHGLLQKFNCEIQHQHLPEDFERAKSEIEKSKVSDSNLVLISGGASVGDKDFTRPLLEWLGFEIIFSQVNMRPGKPLIFGVADNRVAFGLPGNPLSHFVCFHFAVTTALARLVGEAAPNFFRGRLAAKLNDAACARETLWPARLDLAGLHPLPWASSGDVACFAAANALIRVPANCASLPAGAEVDFLPAGDMMGA